jgi:hypothetical protein
MKLNEQPIQPGILDRVLKFGDGKKSDVFGLVNTDKEKLVVKFQNEAPVEALAGTGILKRAGVTTPETRVASKDDIANLEAAVKSVQQQFPTEWEQFEMAKPKWKYVLLMEWAEGITLKKARTEQLDEFLRVLGDATFQTQLGRMAAADAFAGNHDRMFGIKMGVNAVEGFYNEGNVYIGATSAVAIDNAFRPGLLPPTLMKNFPWGYKNNYFQFGSCASASPSHVAQEAELIFEVFLTTAEANHTGKTEAIDAITKARQDYKGSFIQNFTQGALATIKSLLGHGQQWKQKLMTEWGADEGALQKFRVRKRMLRQFYQGVEPQDALQRTQNVDEYRKWALTNEYGLSELEADELLAKGVEAYKAYKKNRGL